MRCTRGTTRFFPLAVATLLAVGVPARAFQDAAAQPAPVSDPNAELLRQLDQYRLAIVNTQSGIEARGQAAAFLVSGEMFPAKVRIIHGLLTGNEPQARLLIAGALVAEGLNDAGGLPADFVDPLIAMLSSETAESRTLAAQGLAYSRDPAVAGKVGALARDEQSPMPVRFAAIEALAPNMDRREVAAELVALLDGGTNELTKRVVAVLESATGESGGMDVGRWKAWWSAKSKLDDLAWLNYRMEYHRDRDRVLEAELRKVREQISGRLRDFQKESFRAIPREQKEQREARLADWLRDPLPDVRQNALGIIAVLVGDEGYRPAGDVQKGLVQLLSDPVVDVRIASVRIVQNLQDPTIVAAVLARLKDERSSDVRQALLRALGVLGGAEAVEALIAEVGPDTADQDCVMEAAAALGQIAARLEDRSALAPAVGPLEARYAAAPAEAVALRSALLRGMAGIADPSFTDEFLAGLDSDQAEVLKPAIRGLVAVRGSSRLERLRDLIVTHADAGVRLAAIEAVGQFGRDVSDLECLLSRLNSTAEPSEQARDAAWAGFTKILTARSLADQLNGVERLRDLPGFKIRYLSELEERLASQDAAGAELDQVRDRLAAELVAAGEYATAVDHLRDLYRSMAGRRDPRTMDVGLRLIEAALRGPIDAALPEVLAEVVRGTDGREAKSRIVAQVRAYLESDGVMSNRARMTALLAVLRDNSLASLGTEWSQMLSEAEARLASTPAANGEPREGT